MQKSVPLRKSSLTRPSKAIGCKQQATKIIKNKFILYK